MKRFLATIIIQVEDTILDRKADLKMVEGHISDRVKIGIIHHSIFRQSIDLDIKKVTVNIQEIE